MTWTEDELEAWIGRHAVDGDGEKIGKIADVYIDDATGNPEWLAVHTGLFGTRISFVPLQGATRLEQDVVVGFDKSHVKDSPNVDADGQLSEEEEERLYSHYGLTYSRAAGASNSGGLDPDMLEAGSASIGSEVSAETARLRLRKREAEALDEIELSSDDEYELGVEDFPQPK